MMVKLITKKALSLKAAKMLVGFAFSKAKELKVGAAIALVDDGGHLICLERLDGTIAAAANIAIAKAATAMDFKRPGSVLEETVTIDRPAMKTLNCLTTTPFLPLKGSYPIEIDGNMVGAIAVAGAGTGQNDELIALFAIEKFMNLLI